jgi:hypothetical protein
MKLIVLLALSLAQTDCQIALNAWNDMGGNPSYAPSTVNCCNNYGITCASGSIISVTGVNWGGSYFSQRRYLSPILATLPSLRSLAFSSFNLTTIPNFIFTMNKLAGLSLTYSGLRGPIPPELGQLPQLTGL